MDKIYRQRHILAEIFVVFLMPDSYPSKWPLVIWIIDIVLENLAFILHHPGFALLNNWHEAMDCYLG